MWQLLRHQVNFLVTDAGPNDDTQLRDFWLNET
jgi:hypothetical protein